MSTITIQVEQDVQRKLAELARSVASRDVKEVFRTAAREVALAERSAAPKASGKLTRSIRWFLSRRSQPFAYAKIENKIAPHANLVIRGTTGRRKSASVMRFKPPGRRKFVFRRSVGPMPANDFWGRVAGGMIHSVGARLISTMQSIIERKVAAK